MLAPLNRRAEDVGIEAVIIAELKFRDVKRHIFGGHFVERANNNDKAANRGGLGIMRHLWQFLPRQRKSYG